MGQTTTMWAVSSFSAELIISAFAISPIYIFVKFVVMPSIVAGLVEGDVKTAQAQYREKMKMKRQNAGPGTKGDGRKRGPNKLVSISEDLANRASRRLSRAISLGGASKPEVGGSGGSSFREKEEDVWVMEGGGGGTGVQMNPITRLASSSKAGARAETGNEKKTREGGEGGGGGGGDDDNSVFTHYDGEGNPYFEHVKTGRVSYSAPDGWYEDRRHDEWDASFDEQTQGTFYVNRRTRRTTWTAKGSSTEVDVGRAGNLVEVEAADTEGQDEVVVGGQGAKEYRGTVGTAVRWKKSVDEEGGAGGAWDAVLDSATGSQYFVNRGVW